MFVVDTNVLLYAANNKQEEHKRCAALLESWRTDALPWSITWGIAYEFLRVSTHPNVFAKPLTSHEAWRFLAAVLHSPGMRVLVETNRHPEIVESTLRDCPTLRGNLFHDAHTAILMREHGIGRIYTRDRDFRYFPFLEAIDPLA